MGKQSSAKKVARAAKAGGRTKVRSSQGLVFPVALGVVLLLGLLLIVYARQSQPAPDATEPLVGQHWHAAYGVYACDQWLPPLQNQKDDIEGTPIGIHSHADGVIHIHPFTSRAAGTNARLGVFFDVVGIEMNESRLRLPEDQGTFEAGDDCQGKPGQIKALVWDDANTTGNPRILVTDFNNIRFTNDRMAMALVFVNPDEDLSQLRPPSVPTLDNLSDVDPDEGIENTGPVETTEPTETTAPPTTTG
jgi:hypothetical protein